MVFPNIPASKKIPFLLFLIPLILGIVTGWHIILFSTFLPIIMILGFIVIVFLILLCNKFLKHRQFKNIAILALLFIFGCLLAWWHNDRLRSDYVGRYLKQESQIEVKLISPLTESANSWKAKAQVLAIAHNDTFHSVQGQIFLYFEKQEVKPNLDYGDVLVIPNHLQPIVNAGNPGSFDYAGYCRAHYVGYSAYLPLGSWQLIEKRRGSKIAAFFIETRMRCVDILKKYITSKREAGVASALLLGYREGLDPNLVTAYANVGVVHLIAISGLHVGLIYLILLWLFKLLPKGTKKLQGVLIGLVLWSFTLLTGAHPSTLRATVMFTFFIFGRFFFHREPNSLNILAASAFMLLCINPYMLFDVGFQLSYLAVGGILIFQHPIEELFWSRYKAVNYCWKMMSVSLAAQILVFPLVLYYFHQFPTVFLLSNLVLIPASTVALYGEVLLLLLSFFSWMAEWVRIVVTKVLFFINESVLWANNFSFIHLEYSHLTGTKLILLYLLILFLCVWLMKKVKPAFIFAVGLFSVLCVLEFISYYNGLEHKDFIMYNIQGYSAYEWVDGDSSILYSRLRKARKPDIFEYTLSPAKEALGIKFRRRIEKSKSFFFHGGEKIMVISKGFCPDTVQSVLDIDYIFLSKYNQLSMKALEDYFAPQAVIFDASVYEWQKKKWKTACKKLNLHYFSVSNSGAWRLSLEK